MSTHQLHRCDFCGKEHDSAARMVTVEPGATRPVDYYAQRVPEQVLVRVPAFGSKPSRTRLLHGDGTEHFCSLICFVRWLAHETPFTSRKP